MNQMKQYVLQTPAGTRQAPNLEAIEQLLPHLPPDLTWQILVRSPHGTRRLRSGIGPQL